MIELIKRCDIWSLGLVCNPERRKAQIEAGIYSPNIRYHFWIKKRSW